MSENKLHQQNQSLIDKMHTYNLGGEFILLLGTAIRGLLCLFQSQILSGTD